MHGPGDGSVPYEESFPGIREAAINKAKSPADGGNEAPKGRELFLTKTS